MFLLQLILGVGYAMSSSASVTAGGAGTITRMQTMILSFDLLLRREQAEEQAGTHEN